VLFLRYGFDFTGRNASIQIPWLTLGVFKHHSASRYNATCAHYRMVHYNGAHANENIVFHRAAMHNSPMPNTHPRTNRGCSFLVGAVNDGSILNIRFLTDADAVHIATQYGVKPHGTIISQYNVAYNGGVFGYKALGA
jgi:hypothetical protein